MKDTEALYKKLLPFLKDQEAGSVNKLRISARFDPDARRMYEHLVLKLSEKYDVENQILFSLPEKPSVGGAYSIGQCRYGDALLDARFGLRAHDFLKHTFIGGSTGFGKSNTLMQILKRLCELKNPFGLFDPKGSSQYLIKKPWARDVKFLHIGSDYAPYEFNPLKPLPGQDLDDMIASVISSFCGSQYLGYGAESLLRSAVYAARDKGELNLVQVYKEFKALDTKTYRKSQWAVSTERALKAASTGVLGKVLNAEDNVPFSELMESMVIFGLDKIANDQHALSLFLGLFLDRAYNHMKIAGDKEILKYVHMLEESHALFDADKGKDERGLEFMVRMVREFGIGMILIDQNPASIPRNVLANMNNLISHNLGNSQDIHAMATAMAMEPEEKRYFPRLKVGEAICKVKDRLGSPVLVRVDAPDDVRKPPNPSPEEVKIHNRDFVKAVPKEIKGSEPDVVEVPSPAPLRMKFTPVDRKILRYVKINPGVNFKSVYISHGMSESSGLRIINKLRKAGVVEVEEGVKTFKGSENQLYLSETGEKYLENTEDSRRLGGPWHRSAVDRIASHYGRMGFVVHLEYRGADILIDKGSERVAVQVESLNETKDYIRAVHNIVQSAKIADRVYSVVRDKTRAKKLRECVKQSPLKSYRGLKVRLLGEYPQ